ncbi:cyclic amp receptor 2 [Fusarium austroafricanum]|uniref:Cyclic amp receptor 2 n=1 Tax=Fusarium austroafricanum TaxID=2364996 RepID=A0A8H4KH18_9HYPO|nr:cyclic amp receptor 2 [Fusarium austroafricanum]
MAIDIHRAISSVTLAGSVMSFFATTSVLISFAIYRHHIRTFRHMLILELMLFEFANNLNNSTSGIWHLKNGELSTGRLCTVNGFIGQFSAQGVDLSILAVAVVTLFTVTRRIYMPAVTMTKRICICLSICILPLITSIIPTFMGEMQPVGGNWCWIATNRPDLRYTMAHGWRIFVIFSTVTIYIYIWVYLRRRLGSRAGETRQVRQDAPASSKITCLPPKSPKRNGFQAMDDEEFELDLFERVQPNTTASNSAIFLQENQPPRSPRDNRFKEINLEFGERTQTGPGEAQGGFVRHRPTASKSGADLSILETAGNLTAEASQSRQSQHSQVSVLQTNSSEFHMRPNTDQVELEIKRMLLLNAYPFMYVLLWAPGLINRLMEASGNPNSKTINVALQAPTQFIGLANALTYGFNHYLRDRLNDLYLKPMIARIKDRIGLC